MLALFLGRAISCILAGFEFRKVFAREVLGCGIVAEKKVKLNYICLGLRMRRCQLGRFASSCVLKFLMRIIMVELAIGSLLTWFGACLSIVLGVVTRHPLSLRLVLLLVGKCLFSLTQRLLSPSYYVCEWWLYLWSWDWMVATFHDWSGWLQPFLIGAILLQLDEAIVAFTFPANSLASYAWFYF